MAGHIFCGRGRALSILGVNPEGAFTRRGAFARASTLRGKVMGFEIQGGGRQWPHFPSLQATCVRVRLLVVHTQQFVSYTILLLILLFSISLNYCSESPCQR